MAQMKKAGPAKPVYKTKAKAKSNAAEKVIQDITNRFRVTAREARDIVTAVGNVGVVALNKSDTGFSAAKKGTGKNAESQAPGGRKNQLGKAVKDLKNQISETGKAATAGKKGTSTGKFYTNTGEEPMYLKKGKKRK
jgi:hypothetical protein